MHRAVVLITALVAVLAACGTESPPAAPIDGHPATLAGTNWVVTAIGGLPTARGAQPTIGFDSNVARGSGGCNTFGGSYRYEPTTGELRFSELGMTAMACTEQARNDVETAFIRALGQPSLVATLRPDGHLVLASPAGVRLDLDAVGPTVTD